ncbi:LAMI_0B08020g1_1 [Lachancea mirantina]|uniref:U three protein 23 n=1 Tax=Lachancea mirantina TaxID=1230905 RepID=A0A1G4IXL3_9SACH|nr:LAMI_0B08020g1_1 [Lachancea mirantina]
MRQKRAKSYRKQMVVYNHNFKFREPYQVLVDDQIVADTCKSAFDLVKGLQRTLQAEVKPMITQCCMQALYEARDEAAIAAAKAFERRRCNHPPREAKPPAECVDSVVNVNGANKHRYVVATQDVGIRRALRNVPGVPLVYMNRSVMVMEPLSRASEQFSRAQEAAKLVGGLNDAKYAGVAHDGGNEMDEPQRKKRKGVKGPNPLSVKKKVATATPSSVAATPGANEDPDTDRVVNGATDGKQRRRKRHHRKSILADATVHATMDATGSTVPASASDNSE